MNIAKCFKSGNTLRVTLNCYNRRLLNAIPGDMLKFEPLAPGECAVVNLSHNARTKTKRKRK